MKFTALATALALVTATSPAIAAPTNPAASLSVANVATAQDTTARAEGRESFLENPYVSVAMAVAAVAGILLVAGAVADDDDQPDSA